MLETLGTYEWLVVSFGLKNDGATYQRATNLIFHDLIGDFMQVYIDDIEIKLKCLHLDNLSESFGTMRKHGLKINSLKCDG